MKQTTLYAISGLIGSTATITSLYMTEHKLEEMLEEDHDPDQVLYQTIKAGILGIGAGIISGTIGAIVTDYVFISFSKAIK